MMIKQSRYNFMSRAYMDSDATMKRSQYSSILNMGKPNKYCTKAEAPVCPPMWTCPLKNVMPQMPPSQKMHRDEIPKYTERVLRRPTDPFPGGAPDLVIPGSSTPSSASGGASTDDTQGSFCQACGPRIEGVIGVPNANADAPWPEVDASGAEVNPFIVTEEFAGAEASDLIRSAGNYKPEYTNYEAQNVLIIPLTVSFAVRQDLITLGTRNEPPNWDKIPASGTVFMNGERIQYASKRIIDFKYYVLGSLTRALPQAQRTAKAAGKKAIVLIGAGTGNTSATITAGVDADRSATAWNLETNLSRGRGFTDNSKLVVPNSNLGGTNVNGGITLVTIRTTHWPDEDVSSCIVAEDESKIDIARQYCCFNDTLTQDDWSNGGGRCAALALYSVARPGEWAQYCPVGYEYSQGNDGLFCKKCKTGTSTFDPAVNPANCPANGVGCQQCCEDPGVLCN
jgi:hypothetical protein